MTYYEIYYDMPCMGMEPGLISTRSKKGMRKAVRKMWEYGHNYSVLEYDTQRKVYRVRETWNTGEKYPNYTRGEWLPDEDEACL